MSEQANAVSSVIHTFYGKIHILLNLFFAGNILAKVKVTILLDICLI